MPNNDSVVYMVYNDRSHSVAYIYDVKCNIMAELPHLYIYIYIQYILHNNKDSLSYIYIYIYSDHSLTRFVCCCFMS